MSSRRANAVCRIKEIPLLVESYCSRMNDMGMDESYGGYGRFVCESEEKVIFKKDRKDGEVIAFFPETMFDGSVNPGNIMSYVHNGQSGEASLDYFHSCRPCSDESEYAELLNELEWYLNQDPEEGHTTIKVVRKPYYGRSPNLRKMWPMLDSRPDEGNDWEKGNAETEPGQYDGYDRFLVAELDEDGNPIAAGGENGAYGSRFSEFDTFEEAQGKCAEMYASARTPHAVIGIDGDGNEDVLFRYG